FWRSISRDNVTTWYGRNAGSRIVDPNDASRIFAWLICSSNDDKGNVIVYEYALEDSSNVESSSTNERNRSPASRAVNRYINRIRYGNKTWFLVEPDLAKLDWHFHVVFDYGENHFREISVANADPSYVEAWSEPPQLIGWPRRADPFSTFRPGFELRTY